MADQSWSTGVPIDSDLENTTLANNWSDTWSLEDEAETFKQPLHMIIVYSVAYAAVFFLGVAGNGLVIWIVYSNPKMHDVTNYLIVNLAVADILVCVLCLPITLLSNLYSGWRFGAFMCKATPFLQGVSVNASVNTLMAIALDRYLAICHILKFRLTRKMARSLVVFIWLFAVSLMSPWAVYYHQEYSSYHLDKTSSPQFVCLQVWPSVNMERIYFLIAIFLTCYTIPLTCISVCYALIGYRVCNRHTFVKECQSSSDVVNKSKVKVVKMLVVVVVMFAFSWLPLYVVNLRLYFGGPLVTGSQEFHVLVTVVIPVIQWSGLANSCVNPIIYCFFSRKFREGFRYMIVCRRRGLGSRRRPGLNLSQRRSTIHNSFSYTDCDHQLRVRNIRMSIQASVKDSVCSNNEPEAGESTSL